ncbi:MAG: methyltransferase domain-containing protein [Deltaproteobacteria bacterium]|nr:methyltransferase domain-containing protein [Deltaproteobacteria bacterium]
MSRVLLVACCLLACGKDRTASEPSPRPSSPTTTDQSPKVAPTTAADPDLERDQREYVDDVVAFTKSTAEAVRTRMKRGSEPLKEEWLAWEKKGPMTNDRITAFYKQTTNYIYELAEWHLWVPDKRASDVQLVADMRTVKAKNILDFGGGVGLIALPLARAGFDVTLADLSGTSLDFAQFRAKNHNINVKIWKTDVDAAPPDKKYDVILCMDVLEHLPREVLNDVVDKLIKLKHAGTRIVIAAPFGRTSVHPMHLDADDNTKLQVKRLQEELPPDAG